MFDRHRQGLNCHGTVEWFTVNAEKQRSRDAKAAHLPARPHTWVAFSLFDGMRSCKYSQKCTLSSSRNGCSRAVLVGYGRRPQALETQTQIVKPLTSK